MNTQYQKTEDGKLKVIETVPTPAPVEKIYTPRDLNIKKARLETERREMEEAKNKADTEYAEKLNKKDAEIEQVEALITKAVELGIEIP